LGSIVKSRVILSLSQSVREREEMIVGEVISVENKSIVHVIRRTGKLKVDSHEESGI